MIGGRPLKSVGASATGAGSGSCASMLLRECLRRDLFRGVNCRDDMSAVDDTLDDRRQRTCASHPWAIPNAA